ncbi:MAG TPA: glycerophosphodiester phosphodiesterase [Acidimicrobiia bacterium]|nr:glycerophosphodiester phosphodiesterase [Acidimicrobiia bacterium]
MEPRAPDEASNDPPSDQGSRFFGGSTVVVGHRGDPARHPENSLAGVMAGLAAVGRVEIDLRLTADGRLILSHDPETAGRAIAESTWSMLAHSDAPTCLLDEVLAIPGHLDLELKNLPGEPGFDPEGRMALMVASRARSSDILTSFYWPDMDLIRRYAGGVPTGLLVGEGGSAPDALAHAVDRGHRAIVLHHSLIDGGLCRAASEACIEVMAWTVNSVDKARELSGMGVTAIISDDPRSIYAGLRE